MSMAVLNDMQEELCRRSRWDFSDLSAVFINCTLKKSPERSHTQGLIDISAAIMERSGVKVTQVRAGDHVLAPGVWPDMTENLLPTARMITDAGGWPVHGNRRAAWDAGCRFDFDNPEHC